MCLWPCQINMGHIWRLIKCRYCGNFSLDKTCYTCRIMYAKPSKEEEEFKDRLEIKLFENIGSKW